MRRSNGRSPSPSIKRRRERSFHERSPERSHRPRTRSPSYESRYVAPRQDEYPKPPEPTEPYYRTLCISSLHPKASDELIKDTLYREFRNYDTTNIKIQYDSDERLAYVCFRNCEDARDAKEAKSRIVLYDRVAVVEKAYEVSKTSKPHYRDRSPSFNPRPYYDRPPQPPSHFGAPYRYDHRTSYRPVTNSHHFNKNFDRREHQPGYRPKFPKPPAYHDSPYLPSQHVYDSSRFPVPRAPYISRSESKKDKFPNHLEHVSPEDDPLATRTLFVGNLEVNILIEELDNIFGRYGIIEDIDIKRPPIGSGNAFAFVRFQNLNMAHKAKVALSGQFIGLFQCKIGYGKAVPTPCVWVGGLGSWTSVTQLEREFDRFGAIKKLTYVKGDDHAYILYETVLAASEAVKEMRGYTLGGPEHRLKVDFSGFNVGESKPETYKEYRSIRSSSPITNRSRSRSRSLIRSEKTASTTLSQIASNCSTTLKGSFILKLSRHPANFYLIHGNDKVFDSLINEEDGERQIKITQRLRLGATQLQSVKEKIANAKSYSIFLALTNSSSESRALEATENGSVRTRRFNNLVLYLKEKEAAGIMMLIDKETTDSWSLYSFPSCSFSAELLRNVHPDLSDKAMEETHLVIVAVNSD